MAYPIQEGKLYNLVMSHPGKAPVRKWNEPGNLEEMKTRYNGPGLVICMILKKFQYCLKWASRPPCCRGRVSSSGKVELIGDAAHAMAPRLAHVCTAPKCLHISHN